MKTRNLASLLLALTIPVFVSACGGYDDLAADVAGLKAWTGWDNNKKVGPNKSATLWMQRAYAAICQLENELEKAHTGALAPADRLCHAGNPDHGTPPEVPPFI